MIVESVKVANLSMIDVAYLQTKTQQSYPLGCSGIRLGGMDINGRDGVGLFRLFASKLIHILVQ